MVNLQEHSQIPGPPAGRSETFEVNGLRIVGVEQHNEVLPDKREDFVEATFFLA